MGTRHLIAAIANGEYKLAQYGQWDGNPSGQGIDVLQFCRGLGEPTGRDAFLQKLSATRWLSQEEIEVINAKLKQTGASLSKCYPALTRDAGSDILDIVRDAEPGIQLINKLDFAGESLFCEWAYVIDMDAGTLEIFKGFNETPLDPSERFASLKGCDGYEPVKLAATYHIADLPSDEDFVAKLELEEDEEDA